MAKDYSVNIGYPARDRNFVLPLINGEDAWRMVFNHIKNAEKTIHLCYWAMEADMELIRNSNEVFAEPERRNQYTIYNLLYKKTKQGVKVKILLWDYPLNARQDFADTLIRLSGKIGTFEVLYQPHPTSLIGSWHQKTIIIDDNIAFVGGMNAKENDWDTSEHLAFDIKRAKHRLTGGERRKISSIKDHEAIKLPRHDYMTLIKGAIVSDIQSNFVERWNFCVSKKMDYFKYATKLEKPQQSNDFSDVKAQIVRTIPNYEPQPSGEKGILEAYLKAVKLAEKYIYIEDQYFRSVTLAREIAKAAKKNNKLKVIIATPPNYLSGLEPNERFKVAAPSTYWTTESFDVIKEAIPNFSLFFFQSTFINTNNKRIFVPIDLHAKIMIVDDEWYTIGSCNINERGFETEGELNVSVQHSSAKDLRVKILSLHLKEECPEDIDKSFQMWFDHSSINCRAWKSNLNPKSFIFPFNQKGPLLPIVPSSWF